MTILHLFLVVYSLVRTCICFYGLVFYFIPPHSSFEQLPLTTNSFFINWTLHVLFFSPYTLIYPLCRLRFRYSLRIMSLLSVGKGVRFSPSFIFCLYIDSPRYILYVTFVHYTKYNYVLMGI